MSEKTAVCIDQDVPGWAGPAKRFRLEPPLLAHSEVIIFTASAFGHSETVVTPVSGASIQRLPGSVSGFENHEYSLFIAGYALVDESGEPEE